MSMQSRVAPMRRAAILMSAVVAMGAIAPLASAQLRVVTWNVTNYISGRDAAFQTSIYGEFMGRSMSPDVILGQEFQTEGSVTSFLNILNTASGSPGDWAAAPFFNGPDTDNAFFYRTSKVDYLGRTLVSMGGLAPNHPRNLDRYDIRLKGYTTAESTIACYCTHMKAGGTDTDEARRLDEAIPMRDDAESLPAGWHFLVGGDLNVETFLDDGYVELISTQVNDDGRFFDPIKLPGGWSNSPAFATIHTQDPVGAGGMDDRYDQILVSASLIDNEGTDYDGDATIAYSLVTWDDPNHSYRSWGNDATSFNASLTTTGNTMVGPTIAQALKDSCLSAGHLPVFLDILVPARVGSDASIDFGDVPQGSMASMDLSVFNDGDDTLWTNDGINTLSYSLTTGAGLTAPMGSFTHDSGDAANMHSIELDTSTVGPFAGGVVITSNDPEEGVRVVTVTANIVSDCPEDLDGDGVVGSSDLAQLIGLWTSMDPDADLDGSGTVGSGDLAILIGNWGPC